MPGRRANHIYSTTDSRTGSLGGTSHASHDAGGSGGAHRDVGEHHRAYGGRSSGHSATTFLRALHILGRLDAVLKVLAPEQDALGLDLAREQLPKRVHGRPKPSVAVSTAAYRKRAGEGVPVPEASETKRDDRTPNRDRPTDSDDFEGF